MNNLTRNVLDRYQDLTKLNKQDLIDTVEELVFYYSELEEKMKHQTLAFNDSSSYALRIAEKSASLELALEYRKMAEAVELRANNPDAF